VNTQGVRRAFVGDRRAFVGAFVGHMEAVGASFVGVFEGVRRPLGGGHGLSLSATRSSAFGGGPGVNLLARLDGEPVCSIWIRPALRSRDIAFAKVGLLIPCASSSFSKVEGVCLSGIWGHFPTLPLEGLEESEEHGVGLGFGSSAVVGS
jgi:hypothetical protein